MLVNIDGEPIWSPIKDNDLKFAVNTNWDLFQHEPTQDLLPAQRAELAEGRGRQGPVDGGRQAAGELQEAPADDNWKDVKAALPGKKLSADKLPKVFVSTAPAEMILLAGEPKYEPVAGTPLLWVSNTESDVFRAGPKGAVYYLVAGRWFSAPDFTGPWTFATPNLPADFQKIPLEHPRSRVLASVPGTQQAAEAVLLAQVPQTARVNKKELKAPEVAYQGDPKFEPIEKTTVERAVNTDKDIIKVGDLYYMCFQGVWFMGSSPTGPWEVTSKVPRRDLRDPDQLARAQRHLRDRRGRRRRRVGDLRDRGHVHGRDGRLGLRGLGQRLLLPAVLRRLLRRLPDVLRPLSDLRLRRVVQPVDAAPTAAARWPTVRTAAPASARATTRAPGPTRAAPRRRARTARARAGQAYNPRTGAYGQTRQGSNVYGSWGSTRCSAATSGPPPRERRTARRGPRRGRPQRSGGGEAVTRRGPGADVAEWRARAAATSTPATTATSTATRAAAGRSTTTGSWGTVDRPTPTGSRPGRGTGAAPRPRRGRGLQLQPRPDQLNRDSRGARGGLAAHARLRQLPASGAQQRQLLPLERRRRLPWRRRARRRWRRPWRTEDAGADPARVAGPVGPPYPRTATCFEDGPECIGS